MIEMKGTRLIRINEQLREVISEIVQNELNDPRITGLVTILRVDVDNELYLANVYISIYNSKDEKLTFDTLQSCAGFIRKLLSKKVQLRTVPNIKFIQDKNLDYSEKINTILSNLNIPNEEE